MSLTPPFHCEAYNVVVLFGSGRALRASLVICLTRRPRGVDAGSPIVSWRVVRLDPHAIRPAAAAARKRTEISSEKSGAKRARMSVLARACVSLVDGAVW